jgi:hypothetical protein
MSFTVGPEIAAALAPMAESGGTPPAVGDVEGRRSAGGGATAGCDLKRGAARHAAAGPRRPDPREGASCFGRNPSCRSSSAQLRS